MLTKSKTIVTAIVMMAVICILASLSGCATSRQVSEVKDEIATLRIENQKTQDLFGKIDSIIVTSSEANNRLRVSLTTTSDNLENQVASLMEGYNDLMTVLTDIQRQLASKSVLRSSPGATMTTPPGYTQQPAEEVKPSVDCSNAYDGAFIQVRRGEYEPAIVSFNQYLIDCPDHESGANAHYWIGECYYSQDKFTEAVEAFEMLFTKYRNSANASRALYKLGRSQQELGQKSKAKKTFQSIIDDFPNTLESEQARDRLRDL